MLLYVRDTKETFFFLTTIANVSLEFRILYVREKSLTVIWHEKILICGGEFIKRGFE